MEKKKYQKRDKLLNYLVIIQPDQRTGTNDPCFSVYCPILGLAESGDTIEEAMANIKELIKFHLKCLANEKEPIPREEINDEIIGKIQVVAPSKALRFA